MRTWEKIMKLDSEYVEARKQLTLGIADSVEVTVHKKKSEPAVLLKKAKAKEPNATE
jgi:bifunctional DNA-binding transcriptional regulator/antitoxin component of YhaV-PrlF toxin-antitoxin module